MSLRELTLDELVFVSGGTEGNGGDSGGAGSSGGGDGQGGGASSNGGTSSGMDSSGVGTGYGFGINNYGGNYDVAQLSRVVGIVGGWAFEKTMDYLTSGDADFSGYNIMGDPAGYYSNGGGGGSRISSIY